MAMYNREQTAEEVGRMLSLHRGVVMQLILDGKSPDEIQSDPLVVFYGETAEALLMSIK